MQASQAFLAGFVLLVGLPGSAQAWTVATTDDGEELRWPADELVPFRMHFAGSDDLDPLALETLTRQAFATWAEVPSAQVSFEEDLVYTGPAAHHAGPSEVDGQSAIFFIEALWPHGTQVIALTSVSFAADGQILDADIAFNGADHTFTTSDAAGVKDFLSIATHEVGHFMGLAHPDPDVPTATMTATYVDGTIGLRDLDPDDAAGLAHLYPCGATPCVGEVGWVAGGAGCALTEAGTAAVASIALALLLLVGLRRRGSRSHAAGLAILLAIGLPGPVSSSLMEQVGVGAMADQSARVVRARVLSVQPRFEGIVRRTVELEVLEDLGGSGPARLTLDLPGGELVHPIAVSRPDGRPLAALLKGTLVFGAPRVSAGDEIVAFVDEDGRVPAMAQGLFHVDPAQGLSRDMTGLALVRAGERWGPAEAPSDLASLRAALAR